MSPNLNDDALIEHLSESGHFRVHLPHSIPVVLKANDQVCAQEFVQQLYVTVSTYSGGIWKLIQSAICNGIDWPTWWGQYSIDRQRYLDQIAGLQFFDDTHFANDAAARTEKWRRVDLCIKLDGLASEEVHFPDYYETVSLVPADRIIPKIRWMTDFQLANYVIKCYPRHRLFQIDENSTADENFWQDHSEEFEAHGLVSSGTCIPVQTVLKNMPNTDLRKLLAKFGTKASARRVDNEHMLHHLCAGNPRVEAAVCEAGVDEALRCKMPPDGITWAELQAYRWQIRGMTGSLFDFLHNPQSLRQRFPSLFDAIFQESGLNRKNCGFLF